MIFDPNPLFYKMAAYYSQHKNDPDKVIIFNEGGSRSSKTWDTIHLVFTYCDHNRGKGKEWYVFRDTLTNCKDYTLKEFQNCFKAMQINVPVKNPQKPEIDLFGNRIYFRGLVEEQDLEPPPCDGIFANEILDINDKSMLSGWIMRCRDLFIGDCNPKYTDHWAFDLERRPNSLFTHSTYLNNKHLQPSVIRELESYNPNIQANIDNGTADDYRYKVYVLGLRASPEGLIYPNVTWVQDMPEEFEKESFGLDFGYTIDPACLVQVRIHGLNLYAKKLLYYPFENASAMAPYLHKLIPEGKHFWCDSADPTFINDLRRLGFKALSVKKAPNYKMPAIGNVKRFKLHFVTDADVRREQENYRYRVVHGFTLDEPIDGYDHFFDALLYATMHEIRVGI